MNNITKKRASISAVIALIVAVIVYGYDSEYALIKQCDVHVSTYVTAEYSEMVLVGTDANGVPMWSTDYWSEPASDVFVTITSNGELVYQNRSFDMTNHHSAYYPPIPRKWNNVDPWHLDGFDTHIDTELKVMAILANSGEATIFSDPIENNLKCILKVDHNVDIKTWYGISYGFNF